MRRKKLGFLRWVYLWFSEPSSNEKMYENLSVDEFEKVKDNHWRRGSGQDHNEYHNHLHINKEEINTNSTEKKQQAREVIIDGKFN